MNQSSEFLQGEAKSPLEVIAGLVAKCRSQEERIRELEANEQAWMAKEFVITAENLRLSGRVKELEEAMPNAMRLTILGHIIRRGMAGTTEGDALRDMADRIEKVMRGVNEQ